MNFSICVVIVTYNRIQDLKHTLAEYEQQTQLPVSLIVVDNASTDGTSEYLDEWEAGKGNFARTVIRSESNCGGAGGFALGLQEAAKRQVDFVFLSDDDAMPNQDVFEHLLDCYSQMERKDEVAALCTRVNDQFGISSVHRARVQMGLFSIKRSAVAEEEYAASSFDVDLLTFVGALIKLDTIKQIGYPIADYFIHEDDAEYSARIKKIGRIVCSTKSIMTHPYGGDNAKDWIEYYTTRNYIDYIGRHYPRRYQIYAMLDKYIKKCSIIAKLVKHRSKNFRKMNFIAIQDGREGKLGISQQYKPGQIIG